MEYTGSRFEGDRVNGRLEGQGEYTFPNGTKYVGEMKDGEFHGQGVLHFPNGASFTAEWKHGKAIGPGTAQGVYTFQDGLKFEEAAWTYCDGDDRRFYEERVNGLRPGGETLEVNAGPAAAIPAGCYDVGDGYLDVATSTIYSYDGSVLRRPDPEEVDWAQRTCRRA